MHQDRDRSGRSKPGSLLAVHGTWGVPTWWPPCPQPCTSPEPSFAYECGTSRVRYSDTAIGVALAGEGKTAPRERARLPRDRVPNISHVVSSGPCYLDN